MIPGAYLDIFFCGAGGLMVELKGRVGPDMPAHSLYLVPASLPLQPCNSPFAWLVQLPSHTESVQSSSSSAAVQCLAPLPQPRRRRLALIWPGRLGSPSQCQPPPPQPRHSTKPCSHSRGKRLVLTRHAQ